MKTSGGLEKLLRKADFVERIISVVFDEAHCISKWAVFRPEYKALEQLRHVTLKDVPVAAASATFPHDVKEDVKRTLHLQSGKLVHIARSIDRPNVHLAVRKIQHPLNSYLDLAFVLPPDPSTKPPKFIVFFDDINDAVGAAMMLRNRLPPEHADKIVWFTSQMSETYKRDAVEMLLRGDIWGICATDSFGMVSTLAF